MIPAEIKNVRPILTLRPEFVPSEIALSAGLGAPVLRDHLISARTMVLRRLILESRFRQTAIAA
jgi:hypothetical protein